MSGFGLASRMNIRAQGAGCGVQPTKMKGRVKKGGLDEKIGRTLQQGKVGTHRVG